VATTLTRNLKLRINSNLTADAKYNLERLDLLGSTFLVDTTNDLNIRSETDIVIEPESADIGGSGVGGSVSVGTSSHDVTDFSVYATNPKFNNALALLDKATSGTRYLRLRYKSDVAGSLDTVADRTLSIDLQAGDRTLVLGGDFRTESGGNSYSLQADLVGNTEVEFPTTGRLATLAGVETLTNKSIDADDNTIVNIRNAEIASNAAIQYSKLDLSGSVVNADISPSAGIQYSKLSLTNSITNADVASSAAIQYSKLSLTGSIIGADISPSAAVEYSKLNLANSIQETDLSPGFSLPGTQVDPDFGSQTIATSGRLRLSGPTYYTELRAAQSGQLANLLFSLPTNYGSNNQVLTSDGAGGLSWTTAAGSGTVVSYAEDWVSGDGTTKVVTHNLGLTDVEVTVIDLADDTIHLVSSIEVTDSNTITLTSSEAPASSWRVVIQA